MRKATNLLCQFSFGSCFTPLQAEPYLLELFRQQNMLESPAVQQSVTIGALSLALNLALTGFFIILVIRLLNKPSRLRPTSE